MSKKANAIQYVHNHLPLLQCPICGTNCTILAATLQCDHGHSFDFSKQGYLNLLTKSVREQYDKRLFTARKKIITETKLYEPIYKEICELINKRYSKNTPITIADLGCGEGSHLNMITDNLPMPMVKIGIDISKDGIMTAAKTYDQTIWLVADLAKLPLQDHKIDVLLNIFSPASYQEFQRIAAKDAVCIKIIPGRFYLKELREYLAKESPAENKVSHLFQSEVHLEQVIPLQYKTHLTQDEVSQLVEMTPLTWSADKEKLNSFIKQGSRDITIDVNILIGTFHNKTKGRI